MFVLLHMAHWGTAANCAVRRFRFLFISLMWMQNEGSALAVAVLPVLVVLQCQCLQYQCYHESISVAA